MIRDPWTGVQIASMRRLQRAEAVEFAGKRIILPLRIAIVIAAICGALTLASQFIK